MFKLFEHKKKQVKNVILKMNLAQFALELKYKY